MPQAFVQLALRLLLHQLQEHPTAVGCSTPAAVLVPALGQVLAYSSANIQVGMVLMLQGLRPCPIATSSVYLDMCCDAAVCALRVGMCSEWSKHACEQHTNGGQAPSDTLTVVGMLCRSCACPSWLCWCCSSPTRPTWPQQQQHTRCGCCSVLQRASCQLTCCAGPACRRWLRVCLHAQQHSSKQGSWGFSLTGGCGMLAACLQQHVQIQAQGACHTAAGLHRLLLHH